MKRQRILVVDDDETSVAILRTFLEEGGFEVEAASDGETALASIEADPPDLVLLDIVMPGLNGYEVLQNLRGRPETRLLPVVLLTALDTVEEKVRGLEAGADDYLTKPYRRDELLARIRTQLRLKVLRDEVEAARMALERRGRSLEALGELRRRLTETIVNDLRAPLSALAINIDGLRREVGGAGAPVDAARFEVIEGCLGTLVRLAREVLDVAGLSPVRLEAKVIPFAPVGILEGALAEAARAVERGGKILCTTLPESIPTMRSDPELLRRTLLVLVTHAGAMSRERGTVEVRITCDGESLEVAVADSGAGLPAEVRDALFAPEASARRGSGPFAGHGLGITFCRMAVETLGGRIWVEPRAGEPGTVYRFRIPIRLQSDPAARCGRIALAGY